MRMNAAKTTGQRLAALGSYRGHQRFLCMRRGT